MVSESRAASFQTAATGINSSPRTSMGAAASAMNCPGSTSWKWSGSPANSARSVSR